MTDKEIEDIITKLLSTGLLQKQVDTWLAKYLAENKTMPNQSGSTQISSPCNNVTEIIIRCGPAEAVKVVGSPCVIPGAVVCPPSDFPTMDEMDDEHKKKLEDIAKMSKFGDTKTLFEVAKDNATKKLIQDAIDDFIVPLQKPVPPGEILKPPDK
jgi:hypothetical protein